MIAILKSKNKKEIILCTIFAIAIIFLAWLPSGFEKQIYINAEAARATVLSVNNAGVYNTGLIKQGDQRCKIHIDSGSHKGEIVEAMNLFTGKIEFDKIFVEGDLAWVLLERNSENEIIFANMVDHYRIPAILVLIGIFAGCLVLFSGFTGVRTLLSFSFALLSIWKILVPLLLKGISPLLVAFLVGNAITIATLLLVAGFTKRAYAAILGSIACSLIVCLLAWVFGYIFNVNGAVMQWSESLLYAGFEHLDLTAIFQAGIYLACSGAILDLAIDISAALEEIVVNQPNISKKELLHSGMRIGRSVVGSQTTTLLLAYMGGYLSVMMVYMAQGTPLLSIFNSKAIAAEILQTFVGCIGLVIVCPLTTLISCAMLLNGNHHIKKA